MDESKAIDLRLDHLRKLTENNRLYIITSKLRDASITSHNYALVELCDHPNGESYKILSPSMKYELFITWLNAYYSGYKKGKEDHEKADKSQHQEG